MSKESGFQLTGSAADHYHSVAGWYIAPLAERMVETVVESGQSVLDVACGTGFAARAAASMVGRSGRVVGIDVNPTMLATARALPDSSPVEIVWQEASAEELPFHHDEFDCAICSQGCSSSPIGPQVWPKWAESPDPVERSRQQCGCLSNEIRSCSPRAT